MKPTRGRAPRAQWRPALDRALCGAGDLLGAHAIYLPTAPDLRGSGSRFPRGAVSATVAAVERTRLERLRSGLGGATG